MAYRGIGEGPVTIAQYGARGVGWTISETGTVDLGTATESVITARIHPRRKSRYFPTQDNVEQQDGIRIQVYVNDDGSWPEIYSVEGDATRLPTLVAWNGRWYSVQMVRDWRSGLLPHLHVEADWIGKIRPATEEQESGTPDVKVVW